MYSSLKGSTYTKTMLMTFSNYNFRHSTTRYAGVAGSLAPLKRSRNLCLFHPLVIPPTVFLSSLIIFCCFLSFGKVHRHKYPARTRISCTYGEHDDTNFLIECMYLYVAVLFVNIKR